MQTDQAVGADWMIYAQKVGNERSDGGNELYSELQMKMLAMSLCLWRPYLVAELRFLNP